MNLTKYTHSEILARIKLVEDSDIFGYQRGDLIYFLDFEHARAYLKSEVTAEQWEALRSKKSATECILDYLPFAWEKANDQRGLSASRSVEHMKSWLWLAGYGEASDRLEEFYEFYGKPCLVIASEIVGFDWQPQDDGCWANHEGEDGIGIEEREALITRMRKVARELASPTSAA